MNGISHLRNLFSIFLILAICAFFYFSHCHLFQTTAKPKVFSFLVPQRYHLCPIVHLQLDPVLHNVLVFIHSNFLTVHIILWKNQWEKSFEIHISQYTLPVLFLIFLERCLWNYFKILQTKSLKNYITLFWLKCSFSPCDLPVTIFFHFGIEEFVVISWMSLVYCPVGLLPYFFHVLPQYDFSGPYIVSPKSQGFFQVLSQLNWVLQIIEN